MSGEGAGNTVKLWTTDGSLKRTFETGDTPDRLAVCADGTLFVAGDFPRFAVLSVTAWRVDELLAAEQSQMSLPGLPAEPTAPVPAPRALADLGSASAIAQILMRARDREAKAATSSELTCGGWVDMAIEEARPRGWLGYQEPALGCPEPEATP